MKIYNKYYLSALLDTLSYREVAIIMIRYGFLDFQPKTLREVGKIFDITSGRVLQIEIKAHRKLRHPSRKEFLAKGGLKEFKKKTSEFSFNKQVKRLMYNIANIKKYSY